MSSIEARRLRERGAPLPAPLLQAHPARLGLDGSLAALVSAAHASAVADGVDGYVDPATGMFCFTAAYHWDKGYCCELGCRHCPWVDADRRLEGPGTVDGAGDRG